MEHAGEDAEYIDTYKTSGGNEVLAVLISGEIFVDFFESFDCDADSPLQSLAGFFEGQNHVPSPPLHMNQVRGLLSIGFMPES